MTEGVARLHRFIVSFTKEAITPFYQTTSITKEQFKEARPRPRAYSLRESGVCRGGVRGVCGVGWGWGGGGIPSRPFTIQ